MNLKKGIFTQRKFISRKKWYEEKLLKIEFRKIKPVANFEILIFFGFSKNLTHPNAQLISVMLKFDKSVHPHVGDAHAVYALMNVLFAYVCSRWVILQFIFLFLPEYEMVWTNPSDS